MPKGIEIGRFSNFQFPNENRQNNSLCTARKIIQVKQKPVSRYTFSYILSHFNTRTWYLHRLFRTYKVRGVWISKHISWYCDTIIWYCPVEPIPKVGTFPFNISTKLCCWDTNNSYF